MKRIDYDANVIREGADRLYRTAMVIAILVALIGALVGFALIAPMLAGILERGSSEVVGLARLLGLLAGGVSGGYIGWRMGFWLRLRAQLWLCQVSIERWARSTAHQPTSAKG